MGRFPSRRALTLAVGVLLLGAGCSKSNRPQIDRIDLDAFEGKDVVSMSDDALRERLNTALEASKFVVLKEAAPEDVRPWRLRLAAGLEEPDIEGAKKASAVLVVLHLRQKGENDGFEVRADERAAFASNDVEAIQDAVRAALDKALRRVVREARALIELSSAKDEAVVAALTDEAKVSAAIRVLVSRKNRAAVPALLEQLKAPEIGKMRVAVGLLVELKAQEAVNPLIEAARGRGPTVEREVIFAVGSIGGEDAEAYLDLVSSGSDDPALRTSADLALQELRGAPALLRPKPKEPEKTK